jgi:hypothetical protein
MSLWADIDLIALKKINTPLSPMDDSHQLGKEV